jgi:hypothetical protein
MKAVAAVVIGLAMAGAVVHEPPAAGDLLSSEPLLLEVSSVGSEASRFVIEGSGGAADVVESAAVHARGVADERIVEITTPASIALRPDLAFTFRLRVIEGSAPVSITVAGSRVPDANRIVLEGMDVGLVRREPGGPVEVVHAGTIRIGTEQNR